MDNSRRLFLVGASLLALDLVAGAALAQDAGGGQPDAVGAILKSQGRGNWSDDFDAQASENGQKVASKLPIFSPETVFYIETAIAWPFGVRLTRTERRSMRERWWLMKPRSTSFFRL